MELIFKSKIAIPVVSRWWKCAPAARKLLLGLACHNILAKLAPTHAKRTSEDARGDDWHQEMTFRIRATHTWFNDGASMS
eukprot:2218420-Pyramimonas_sp.AAC.1